MKRTQQISQHDQARGQRIGLRAQQPLLCRRAIGAEGVTASALRGGALRVATRGCGRVHSGCLWFLGREEAPQRLAHGGRGAGKVLAEARLLNGSGLLAALEGAGKLGCDLCVQQEVVG